MRYGKYQIFYTTNDKGERRWIINFSDERGEEGFKTLDEAKAYAHELMEKQDKSAVPD